MFIGLMGAMIYETKLQKKLSDQFIEKLECDYQKSKSLGKHKYGHLKKLVTTLEKKGGVTKFMTTQCNLNPLELQHLAKNLTL